LQNTPDTCSFVFHALRIELVSLNESVLILAETHIVEEPISGEPGNADLAFEI
jgi:hypothetical protein